MTERSGFLLLLKSLVAVIAAIACAAPRPAVAATFNVAAGDVAGLAAAINTANGNGEANTINLAAGTYSLTSGAYDGLGLPEIDSDLTMIGAGAASTIIERDAGPLTSFRILQAFGKFHLEGVTVRHGAEAIFASGTITIVDCVFADNFNGEFTSAVDVGGAVDIEGSTITGSNLDALRTGGDVTIRNSQIVGNVGVGIATGGVVRIIDSTVAGNGSGVTGGTSFPSSSLFLEIVRSEIRDNAGTGLGYGNFYEGAAARAFVTDSNISGNTGGGIVVQYESESELVVRRSTLSGNSTAQNGGAIFVGGASVAPGGLISVTVDSSTLSGNSAALSGGAIYVDKGLRLGRRVRVLRSTITGNVADSDANGSGDGGGISTPTPVVDLEDSILAGNSDGGGEAPDCAGPVGSDGHNLVGTSAGCGIALAAGDVSGAPLLGPLADNGGPTLTQLPLTGSPAIDAADPKRCGAADQRGLARPVDGNGDTVAACDIGAVEAGAASVVTYLSDNFLCYAAQTSRGTTPLPTDPGVVLADDFESKSFDVRKSDSLCTPANADGRGVADEVTHLHGRDIKESAGAPRHVRQRGIALTTNLGAFSVDTVKPDRLLVPTAKGIGAPLPPPDPASHDVDRFKCYLARGSAGAPKLPRGAVAPTVMAGNQFTPATAFSLIKVAHVCTSVDENGQGRKNPTAELLCFLARVKPPLIDGSRDPLFTGLYSSSEFGTEQLDTKRAYELCVPAVRMP